MTDKEIIRKEIERRKEAIVDACGGCIASQSNSIEYKVLCELAELIDFINSMEEEAVCTGIGEPKEESGVLGKMIKEIKEEPKNHCKDPHKDLDEEPVSKGYRERYKRIAQSEEFKKTYKGMSVGEVMHVEGEESVWIKELQDKLDSLSKEDFEKVWSKYSQYGKSEDPVSEELEKAAVNAFKKIVDSDKNNFLEIFKAGAKWQITKLMKDAPKVTVHIDAGGYPYINCDIEFYDYDKDIPLAKEGDKYKVILIKEE